MRHASASVSLLAPPSSHSSPVSTTPSPHEAARQVVRHASASVSLLAPPSSHSSGTSTEPLPQFFEAQSSYLRCRSGLRHRGHQRLRNSRHCCKCRRRHRRCHCRMSHRRTAWLSSQAPAPSQVSASVQSVSLASPQRRPTAHKALIVAGSGQTRVLVGAFGSRIAAIASRLPAWLTPHAPDPSQVSGSVHSVSLPSPHAVPLPTKTVVGYRRPSNTCPARCIPVPVPPQSLPSTS